MKPGDVPDGDAPPEAWARLTGLSLKPAGAAAGQQGQQQEQQQQDQQQQNQQQQDQQQQDQQQQQQQAQRREEEETSFIVIADPSFAEIEELLAGLDYAFPAARKVGGLSSSGRLSGARGLFVWSRELDAARSDLDAAGVKRTGAAVLALRGPLSLELVIAQGCRPLSRRVWAVAALDPERRNVVTAVTDAETGERLAPVDALRRDLSDPLVPIGGEREL